MPYKDPNSDAAKASLRRRNARWYAKNRDKKCEKKRAEYAANPTPHRERNRLWKGILEHEKRCVNCGEARDRHTKMCSKCTVLQAERTKKCHVAIKREVLGHYSGGHAQCQCCHETELFLLSIDHLNGGGTAHRTQIGGGGMKLYYWLRKNGYPEGYRVLCHNCNQAIGSLGYCPHKPPT